MVKDLPKLYNESLAAEALSLSKHTLRKFRLTGDGPPYVKLGSGVRARVAYAADDLAAWVEAQKRTFTGERRAA